MNKNYSLKEAVADFCRRNEQIAPIFRRFRTRRILSKGASNEYWWMNELAVRDTCAIDVGANVGQSASVMAYAVGPKGEVLALEPNPHCVTQLELGAAPNVKIFQSGAGAASGDMVLHIPLGADNERMDQLGSVHASESVNNVETILVKIEPLDVLEKQVSLPVSLIKIDVEGFELEVIEGADGLLKKHRPAIVFETEVRHQPAGRSVEDVFSKLGSLDYEIQAILPEGLVPVEKIDVVASQRHWVESKATNSTYINNFVAIPKESAILNQLLQRSE